MMEPRARFPQQLFRSRRLPVMIVALTLAVFGASIWFGTILLRENIRAQMVGRDADILHAVALMHQAAAGEGLPADAEDTRVIKANLMNAARKVPGWSNGQLSHPNGNVYDQVLMTGASVTVTADVGQVTRVSFLDAQGDILVELASLHRSCRQAVQAGLLVDLSDSQPLG